MMIAFGDPDPARNLSLNRPVDAPVRPFLDPIPRDSQAKGGGLGLSYAMLVLENDMSASDTEMLAPTEG